MNSSENEPEQESCDENLSIAVPAEELFRYSVDRDPHSEQDIANYVRGQTSREEILNVEKITQKIVLGTTYDIWDVTTDSEKWWVITNLTNLYSQKHFPSLDYTISFHIGLMARLRDGSDEDVYEPTPFDEVFRRQEQSKEKHDEATEIEDYQSVGMALRECLLSLVAIFNNRLDLDESTGKPKQANFLDWCEILLNETCGGNKNKELRKLLKSTSKETWQFVNWLIHSRSANETVSSIAIHSCDTVVGHFIQIFERDRNAKIEKCPKCRSLQVRSHYDISIKPDGDYYLSCGACEWDSHPGYD